jgi:hypothetical protein
MRRVPRPVAGDLVLPVGGVGLRQARAARAIVPVPEAAMHEDGGAAGTQDDVGRAGEVGGVEAEAVAEAVEQRADAALGRGVCGPDAGYEGGAVDCNR